MAKRGNKREQVRALLWERCALWLRQDVTYAPRGSFACTTIPVSKDFEPLCMGKGAQEVLSFLVENIRSENLIRELKLNSVLKDCIHSLEDEAESQDEDEEEIYRLKLAIGNVENEISELLAEIGECEEQKKGFDISVNDVQNTVEALIDLNQSEIKFKDQVLDSITGKIKEHTSQFGIDNKSKSTQEIHTLITTSLRSVAASVDTPNSDINIVNQKLAVAHLYDKESKTLCVSPVNISHALNSIVSRKVEDFEGDLADVNFTVDSINKSSKNEDGWMFLEKEIGERMLEAFEENLECHEIENRIIQVIQQFDRIQSESFKYNMLFHGSEAAKVKSKELLETLMDTLQSHKHAKASIIEAEYKSETLNQNILESSQQVDYLLQENAKLQKLLFDMASTTSELWTESIIELARSCYKLLQQQQNRTLQLLGQVGHANNDISEKNILRYLNLAEQSFYKKTQEWMHSKNENNLDRITLTEGRDKSDAIENLLKQCEQKKIDTIRLVNSCKYANEATVRATIEKISCTEKVVETWWTEPGQQILSSNGL